MIGISRGDNTVIGRWWWTVDRSLLAALLSLMAVGLVLVIIASPGVAEMVERLKTNQPAGAADDDAGVAFIYRDGVKSAMEQTELARHFTLALAGPR